MSKHSSERISFYVPAAPPTYRRARVLSSQSATLE